MSGSQTATPESNTTQAEPPVIEGTTEEVKADNPATSTEASSTEATPPAPEPPPVQKPWYERRIADLTRLRHARDARIQELEAQIAELSQPPEERRLPQTQEELARITDRVANEKAQRLASQQAFDTACNDVYKQGKAEYADFDAVLGNFVPLGGLNVELIEAALATDAPAKVLYHLGKNLDEADRVMQLTPIKKVAELTKIAVKLTTPPPVPKVSNAPKPIPVSGGRAARVPVEDPEKMDMAAWVKWRDAQIDERRKNR